MSVRTSDLIFDATREHLARTGRDTTGFVVADDDLRRLYRELVPTWDVTRDDHGAIERVWGVRVIPAGCWGNVAAITRLQTYAHPWGIRTLLDATDVIHLDPTGTDRTDPS